MKRLLYSTIAIAVILITAGCNGTKKQAPVIDVIEDNDSEIDSTVYGKCGENTAMHTLELITDKGETITYMLEDTDSCSSVQGGLFVGDRLAVLGEKYKDGNMVAKKVINLTSLLGKWARIDMSFEICEGGTIVSDIKESKPYTDWRIVNGRLIMSSDTFDIYSLGPDSLYLENANGIYGYKRLTKEKENNDSK